MTQTQKTLIEAEAGNQHKRLFRQQAFIEGAQFALSIANQWIKIEPGCKMPEVNKKVLVIRPNRDENPYVARFDGITWFNDNLPIITVTHWQPFPLPPTQ